MLERYRAAVDALPQEAMRHVIVYFGVCVTGPTLYDALERMRLMQADLVLALLRGPHRDCLRGAEMLVGRPITRVPSARVHLCVPAAPRDRHYDLDRVVLAVPPNPRCYGKARANYEKIRCGMTVRQLVARGLTRREIRVAVNAGLVLA